MAKVHHRPSGADLSALNKLRKRSIAAAAARSYKTELTTDQIEKVSSWHYMFDY